MNHDPHTATEADFKAHAAAVRAGFAAMAPERLDRYSTPHPATEASDAAAPAEEIESTDARVLREAGLVGKHDLRWCGTANIEHLTGDLLSKKEVSRLGELQTALDRLATEIAEAGQRAINLGKLSMQFPAGQVPPDSIVTRAVEGDEGRAARKKLAKLSATRFFETEALPLVHEIYGKAAALLETAILDRRKAEEAVFEEFAALYNDDEVMAYKPSAGLIRLLAQRRRLLDLEVPHVMPPSARAALAGIVKF